MRLIRLILFLALLTPLGGCGLLAGELATNFDLELTPQSLSIPAGSSREVSVKVTRTVPIDVVPLEVTVELHNPPAGVSAEPLSLPSGINEDTMRLEVAPGTPPGGPIQVKVRGSNGIKTKEATLELTVTAP